MEEKDLKIQDNFNENNIIEISEDVEFEHIEESEEVEEDGN